MTGQIPEMTTDRHLEHIATPAPSFSVRGYIHGERGMFVTRGHLRGVEINLDDVSHFASHGRPLSTGLGEGRV